MDADTAEIFCISHYVKCFQKCEVFVYVTVLEQKINKDDNISITSFIPLKS